jgi:hypothetical protein
LFLQAGELFAVQGTSGTVEHSRQRQFQSRRRVLQYRDKWACSQQHRAGGRLRLITKRVFRVIYENAMENSSRVAHDTLDFRHYDVLNTCMTTFSVISSDVISIV